jgi:2-oxo-4-hydroxy-4-carboxy-5-ureidoimidazoline decarboxylase
MTNDVAAITAGLFRHSIFVISLKIITMPLTINELNNNSRASFVASLGHLFEHSPWVAEETWPRRPFRDAAHLHAELCRTMQSALVAKQVELIRSHPDLAGRLARQNQLTKESTQEQASAGLNQLTDAELTAFQKLNDEYRSKFGFPFIICARLNAKDAIVDAMKSRMGNSPVIEHSAALAEVEKIAWLRLNDVLSN